MFRSIRFMSMLAAVAATTILAAASAVRADGLPPGCGVAQAGAALQCAAAGAAAGVCAAAPNPATCVPAAIAVGQCLQSAAAAQQACTQPPPAFGR